MLGHSRPAASNFDRSSYLSQSIRTVDVAEVQSAEHTRSAEGSRLLIARSERGTVELLDQIGDEWRQLCEEGACDQPFFRPEWIAASIRALATKHAVVLITVREAGRLRAVLPLLEQKVWACGIPATKLRSATDQTPRFDFIHGQGPGIEAALLAGWKELKNQRHWDAVELVNVPDGGAAEHLLSSAKEDGFFTCKYQTARSPYISLGGYKSDGDFSRFAHSRRFRYRLRHYWRKLEKLGEISLRRVESADAEMLQRFYNLEQGGWKGKRGTAIACNAKTRQFCDSIAIDAARYGYLTLYFLHLGDTPVAAHFAFTCGGQYYPLKVAFDENFSEYGPGHLIIGAVLQDCAARGLSEFDCLGQWTEAKARWATEVRVHNSCYIFRPNLAGCLLHAQTSLIYRLNTALRKLKHSLGIVRRGHTPPIAHV